MGRLQAARRWFYKLDGPWYRRAVFEALGSRRYSRPGAFGMDRRLEELAGGSAGVYFEAGAHDGYTQSNTFYLERFCGWRGVLVEPVPRLYRKTARRRRRSHVVQCALVAPERAGETVTLSFGDLMSKVGAGDDHTEAGLRGAGMRGYTVDVPGRTIDDVLDEAGVGDVDIMVLDLEGHELDALRGLDLARRRVGWLVVELLDAEAQRPRLEELIGAHLRFEEMLTPADLLYRRR